MLQVECSDSERINMDGILLSYNFIASKTKAFIIGWSNSDKNEMLSSFSQIQVKILKSTACSKLHKNIRRFNHNTEMCAKMYGKGQTATAVKKSINIIYSRVSFISSSLLASTPHHFTITWCRQPMTEVWRQILTERLEERRRVGTRRFQWA